MSLRCYSYFDKKKVEALMSHRIVFTANNIEEEEKANHVTEVN